MAKAATYGITYYLVMVRYTQLLINYYPSDNKINKAASSLQSHLVEPMVYSDVCLIYCFHKAYFNEHMAWMMESMDLQHTGDKTNGFQSNQMAIRFYVVNSELESLKDSWSTNNPAFADFRYSIRNGGPLTDEEIAT